MTEGIPGIDPGDEKLLETFIRSDISDDVYSATVTVLRHSPDAVFGSDHIRQFLNRNNIIYGLKDEGLQEIAESVKSGPDGKEIVAAGGAALEEGTDGVEDYRFNVKLKAGKIDENKIDFKERGIVNNVKDGQVIAVITQEVPGKPGMCVDGKVLEPRPVNCVKIPTAGNNVVMSVEGKIYTYTTTISGHARLVFKEIQVNEDFIIVGDLDYTKGNIDFVGNVEIKGTVMSGFKVKAGGDVLVGGDVEPDAVIQAAKDVTVKGTIKCGKGPGKIIAGRHVSARRVINSIIMAEGNMFVNEQFLESEVHCDGKFASSTAKIVGSKIEAISGIYANTVGKEDSNAKNQLDAGKAIEASMRVEKINTELEKIKNEKALLAKNVAKNVGYKDGDFSNLEVTDQDRIKRLGAARSKHMKTLNEQEEELKKEKEELLPRLKENPSAKIEITGSIYPTCYIRIGEKEIKVLDGKKGACVIDGEKEEEPKKEEQKKAESN